MRRFLTLIITILTLGILLTGCQLFSTAVSSPSSRQTIAEHSARVGHRHDTDENSDRPYQNPEQDPNQDLNQDQNEDRNKTKKNASSDLPSQMVYLEENCLRATGRKAHLNGRHATLSITHVIKSSERPSSNGEANFSCLGAPCIILHEGAAAVRVNGQYMLFLADDTIEYEGIYKKKKDVSKDTLKWLHFYDSLSEAERNAINMIPSELADELPERFTMETEAIASLAEDTPSYIAALTEKELNETEDLAQSYYNESSSDCEGVDQIYPLDGDFSLYHNAGIEAEYGPGNLIIYKIITVSDRRSGNSYHTVSIARSSKSGAWKIINTGQQGS
ncbi:hypothetical protein [Brotaphodocola sp.]|uniref:hypothetical protein n=1 Tax=Brotaphodocola sp. TaxID=3073577 RepID=UPI003D7E33F3